MLNDEYRNGEGRREPRNDLGQGSRTAGRDSDGNDSWAAVMPLLCDNPEAFEKVMDLRLGTDACAEVERLKQDYRSDRSRSLEIRDKLGRERQLSPFVVSTHF